MGGVAANERYVLIGDRDVANLCDVLRCYAADTGDQLWEYLYPAPGELDYGMSPRATPLIVGDQVILQGAAGHVTAVNLATGIQDWQRDLGLETPSSKPSDWGACSSPLAYGKWVIVNPGAKGASLMALNLADGKTVWKTPGKPAGHGSFVLATLNGVEQLVGHDVDSLGGWDPKTGRRLWTLTPELGGEFNVPTPLIVGRHLIIATETNGARRYAFDAQGKIIAKPVAVNDALAPDMSSLSHVDGRLFCIWQDLYCLDAKTLKTIWIGEHASLQDYGALFVDDSRVLGVGRGGQLLLVNAGVDQFRIESKLDVLPEDNSENFSHPAIVGSRLFLRGDKALVCIDLDH